MNFKLKFATHLPYVQNACNIMLIMKECRYICSLALVHTSLLGRAELRQKLIKISAQIVIYVSVATVPHGPL